jgi:hypothetical protein
VAPRAAELLKPLQLGVGVRGGCEAIIHAIKTLFDDTGIPLEKKWILQVDLENAFNQVDREILFEEVRQHFPELSAWVEASYGSQSHLIFGTTLILSCIGLHQGDPLASLLFALGLQPVLKKLQEEVPRLLANIWFLDDGTLVGSHEDLSHALHLIQQEGPQQGLHLAPHKSHLWCGNQDAANVDPLLRGVPRSSPDGFKLLGAPGSEVGLAGTAFAFLLQS